MLIQIEKFPSGSNNFFSFVHFFLVLLVEDRDAFAFNYFSLSSQYTASRYLFFCKEFQSSGKRRQNEKVHVFLCEKQNFSLSVLCSLSLSLFCHAINSLIPLIYNPQNTRLKACPISHISLIQIHLKALFRSLSHSFSLSLIIYTEAHYQQYIQEKFISIRFAYCQRKKLCFIHIPVLCE